MNMIDSFNKTIRYIEATLEDEIQEKSIIRLSGYSYAMFSRIFSILTGNPLAEYIRSRKLTKAAFALRESKERIIDIAFQYGYDSPDSFSAAFKVYGDGDIRAKDYEMALWVPVTKESKP